MFVIFRVFFPGNIRDLGKAHSVVESGLELGTHPVGKRLLSDQPSGKDWADSLQKTGPIPRTHSGAACAGMLRAASVGVRVDGGSRVRDGWLGYRRVSNRNVTSRLPTRRKADHDWP